MLKKEHRASSIRSFRTKTSLADGTSESLYSVMGDSTIVHSTYSNLVVSALISPIQDDGVCNSNTTPHEEEWSDFVMIKQDHHTKRSRAELK